MRYPIWIEIRKEEIDRPRMGRRAKIRSSSIGVRIKVDFTGRRIHFFDTRAVVPFLYSLKSFHTLYSEREEE